MCGAATAYFCAPLVRASVVHSKLDFEGSCQTWQFCSHSSADLDRGTTGSCFACWRSAVDKGNTISQTKIGLFNCWPAIGTKITTWCRNLWPSVLQDQENWAFIILPFCNTQKATGIRVYQAWPHRSKNRIIDYLFSTSGERAPKLTGLYHRATIGQLAMRFPTKEDRQMASLQYQTIPV